MKTRTYQEIFDQIVENNLHHVQTLTDYRRFALEAHEEYRTQHQELPNRVKCTCANGLEYSNCDKNCQRLEEEYRTQHQELPGDDKELKRQYNIETYGSMSDYDRKKLWKWIQETFIASPAIASRDERIRELEEALLQAVENIQVWHGEDSWDIYLNHAPEMILIKRCIDDITPTQAEGNN